MNPYIEHHRIKVYSFYRYEYSNIVEKAISASLSLEHHINVKIERITGMERLRKTHINTHSHIPFVDFIDQGINYKIEYMIDPHGLNSMEIDSEKYNTGWRILLTLIGFIEKYDHPAL